MAEEIVEHAQLYAGGSMLVRWTDKQAESYFPVEKWIEMKRMGGGRVYRRTVIVVEDWSLVDE